MTRAPEPTSWEAQAKALIRRRYAQLATADLFHADGREKARAAGVPSAWYDALPPRTAGVFSGCGWPAGALTDWDQDIVVDLGCGGGLDTRFVAERLPAGSLVIAVDLTPELLIRVRNSVSDNKGASVQTLAGDMERLPLADSIADVVIANASLNLTTNKTSAFAEVARILRPGGQLLAADLVRSGPLPTEILADPMAMASSLGGVVEEMEFRAGLDGAGFTDVRFSGHRPFGPVIAVDITARK
ncbi:MAG: methyltransferase domain-containing protein [Alphaproteobacteria bacterium]|nr:methyltransferase domain-containing protein [Alphaproteobacteria bacterium]